MRKAELTISYVENNYCYLELTQELIDLAKDYGITDIEQRWGRDRYIIEELYFMLEGLGRLDLVTYDSAHRYKHLKSFDYEPNPFEHYDEF